MKKIPYIAVLFSLLFSLFVPPVYAIDSIEVGKIKTENGKGVHVRISPGTSYERVGGIDDNVKVIVVGKEASTDTKDSCPSKEWNKIVFSSSKAKYGYVCSDFIEPIEVTYPEYDYEKELAKFPQSYQNALKKLHTIYPNAVFVAVDTTNSKANGGGKMTWDTVINNEISLGKSLIWDSNGTRDGLKHLNSYNYDKNAFANNYSGGGKNWYAASREIIAYYLDPRNFLDEKHVFMFESLSFNPNYQVISGVDAILKGTYMEKEFVDKEKDKTFSNTMMDAAIYSQISPYFIASRIKQEVGPERSSLVVGTYPNYPQYNGYYNYYNIGAGGDDVVKNGLNSAYEKGWDSEYKAIVYGAEWIGRNYINKGQNTGYFQKWDVQCSTKSNCFNNQYMQNIEAPSSEGVNTYNGYKKTLGNKMYQEHYVFYIPVYQNMPESTYYPSEKSPINYLSRLVVDGTSVANFHGLTYEYNLKVPAEITSIHIEADAIAKSKGAIVSGTGNIAINSDKQDIIITVTAANGSKRNYTLHVTKTAPEESTMTMEETLSKMSSLTFTEQYSSGLTSYDTLKEAVVKANPAATFTVKNLEGKIVTSGNLATGYQITINVGSESKTFEHIIYGDNSGDGEITILDLLRVQKKLLKSTNLTESQIQASDVNKDGTVDILDLLLVQKHLLGSKYINQ